MTLRERLADWISGGALSRSCAARDYACGQWSKSMEATFKAQDDLSDARARRNHYNKALRSIANNTCCEGCQEAARVAKEALK